MKITSSKLIEGFDSDNQIELRRFEDGTIHLVSGYIQGDGWETQTVEMNLDKFVELADIIQEFKREVVHVEMELWKEELCKDL